MKLLLVLSLFLTAVASQCAVLKDITVFSEKMQKDVAVSVIFPDAYFATHGGRFPVIYALNGYGSNNRSMFWPKLLEIFKEGADMCGVMMVFPDCDRDSWYFDRSRDGKFYETFTTKELVSYIDTRYRTIADRPHRFVVGTSGGGHGAWFLASYHPELYSVVASLSGTADMLWESSAWNTAVHEGDRPVDDCRSINNTPKLKAGNFVLYQDVGFDDHLYHSNVGLHEKMKAEGTDHVYIERPGKHDAPYWEAAYRGYFHFLFDVMKEGRNK